VEKIITIYGECEEDEDPQLIVKSIMSGFERLDKTGYRDIAISTLEEASIALRLAGYLNRKTSNRAKLDGDWDILKGGIENCKSYTELLQWRSDNRSRIAVCPNEWIEPLNELYARQKERVSDA
jgi:hypothetical protein